MYKTIKINAILVVLLLLSACGSSDGTSLDETPLTEFPLSDFSAVDVSEIETTLAKTLLIEEVTVNGVTINGVAIDDLFFEDTNNDEIPIEVSSTLKLPKYSNNYSTPDLPAHFNTDQVQSFDNTPLDNVITDNIATLGRVLFYEKQLSVNATIACASCHLIASGFSDPNQFSIGFQGVTTSRNSMGLTNSKYYEQGHFFWDERADTLEEQVLEPIQNNNKMGLTLEQAESNIIAQAYYPYLFEQAFGDTTVTSDRIALAISQFVRSLVSYQSKYDTGIASNFINFSDSENRGRALFNSNATNCGACHINNRKNGNQAILQPSRAFNNGLDASLVNDDNGVGDVVENNDNGSGSSDQGNNQNGEFKVGSLRNIELTAPYMHDGRFDTLAAVVEHYNSGVQDHPNLDSLLQNNDAPVRMNLSDQDKNDLVAFMLTFTDDNFISDEKFSNPFIFQ